MELKRDRSASLARIQRVSELLGSDAELTARFKSVTAFARRVRVSEYHLTNACNIRCKGCWFFEYGHDTETHEVNDLAALESFLTHETKQRRVNAALVIGGEPTLFQDRLRLFVKHMRYLSVSSNGLKKLPLEGFEHVGVGLTLFGGGKLDDDLRAIKPSGARFRGLFDTALENYAHDRRATFIYALTEDGLDHVEDTVRRIRANGNNVTFNFYSKYGTDNPASQTYQSQLLQEALRVRALYPDTVLSHPYYIQTMITGRSHWAEFGYDVCPSISIDHPAHSQRLKNGNPSLPFFNTWAADLKTLKYCCTSGHCSGCRDSQAVFSWLLVSIDRFLGDLHQLRIWVEIAESYWRQFVWSPYREQPESTATGSAKPSEFRNNTSTGPVEIAGVAGACH